MAAAAPLISDPIVRNLGTIGGSLCHADPAGGWGSVVLAVQALVGLRGGGRGSALSITELRVPQPPGSSGGTYLKMERKVGDFATVAAALHLSLSDGTIERAGIGLTAVGSKNLLATAAEASLAGAEPTEAAFAEAGRLAAEASSPVTDVRGSAEYK